MSTYREFLERRQTAHPFDWNERLSLFVGAYRRHRARLNRPLDVLDIGCGRDAYLASHLNVNDKYHGVDFYDDLNVPVHRYTQVDLNEQSLAETLSDNFDVVFCGEVIEHLFAPDKLVGDISQLMRDDAILVLSTPNLAYWVNRLLLLVGISPLYLENAAEMKLGRRFRLLGQGSETEGHIKVFTYRAMLDLFELKGFEVLETISTITWPSRVDKWIGRFSPSLAANNVFIVRNTTQLGSQRRAGWTIRDDARQL